MVKNKSALIREVLMEGIEKPAEVIAWVRKKYGVEIKAGLVNSVKSKREYEHIKAQKERKEFDQFTCQRCGSTKRPSAHHIGAYSKGGSSLRVNLITLCEECHQIVHSDSNIRIVQTDGDLMVRGCGGP